MIGYQGNDETMGFLDTGPQKMHCHFLQNIHRHNHNDLPFKHITFKL